MKLTHVSVEGCGRFRERVRIEGLGPGVNILSAGNEAGKSTLFRAVRTCLFERHNTAKEEVAALATEGLSLPVSISVGFEIGGRSYEIRKSFLRSKSASLLCDGVESWRNAEADEEVWRLLGIEQKSARALDDAAYGILWVAQGQSFETPEPSEGAKSAFNAAIQQEVGTLVGGERARHVLANVNDELAKFITRTGQPKAGGALDQALKEAARLTDEQREAERLLEALRQRLDDLDRLRREHRTVSDAASLQSLQDQLDAAKLRLAEVEKAASEVKRLAGEERDAHRWAEAQQEKLDSLTARAAAIDERRQRLKQLTAELDPLEAQQAETAKAFDLSGAALARCEAEREALDGREAELQRLEALSQKLARRAELDKRLALLEDFRQRAAANEAALKAATVDEAAVAALAAIEAEEARIRAAMEAGAARIAISARPGAAVTLDGETVTGEATRPVTAPLTIAVGPDVTITVTPPAKARDAAAAALAAERERLSALLSRHGVKNVDELRARRAERAVLEDSARDLKAERTALALKESPAAEIERLAAAIAEISAEARRLLPEGSEPLAAADVLAAERQSLAGRRGALRGERSSLLGEVNALREALTALAGRRGTLRGEADAIHAQLGNDLALLPDEGRAETIAACVAERDRRREAHRIKAAALEQERSRAPAPDEAERQQSRIERFTAALAQQRKAAEDLAQKIAGLEGEVKVAGGEGLGEAASTLCLRHDMAAAEAARLGERVEVLKLLRDTVQSCQDRRREELNRPLLRHLKPFLGDVFPEAELSLGDDFAIAGLSRSGPEAFTRLSLGTQEQVAVLVRLAMGAMICEKGSPVPIILDDALVFSDDARIEQMFDAINRAGKNQQVIVLTCRARSFASLGGRQLQIVES